MPHRFKIRNEKVITHIIEHEFSIIRRDGKVRLICENHSKTIFTFHEDFIKQHKSCMFGHEMEHDYDILDITVDQ